MAPIDGFDEILSALPERRSRSRLEPYGELIRQLLRRGRTYREIAAILIEKCHVHASISTIHDFVRVRAGSTRKIRKSAGAETQKRLDLERPDNSTPMHLRKSQEPRDEVRERIAALKLRRASVQTPPQFQYDASEPLRVPTKPESATDAG
jgi:hypothetical protein